MKGRVRIKGGDERYEPTEITQAPPGPGLDGGHALDTGLDGGAGQHVDGSVIQLDQENVNLYNPYNIHIKERGDVMAPDPNKIIAVLIAVLEDQEGVKIKYTLEKKIPSEEEPA